MAALILAATAPAATAAKYSSIVINEETGAVLLSANPDVRHYPASLTKMMTLYLIFEALDAKRLTMDTRVPVSLRAARQPASKLGLKYRETITVREIILGLAVKSANDAATAIAEHLGGTERKFGNLMSAKARALGMENTRFRNASGLPNRRQLTTARDMAILGRALKRNYPHYYRFFSIRSFTHQGNRFLNHNRLLDRYAGADGIKTGYIRASGFNLVASAKREGVRLIAVAMGTRSPRARDLHVMALLERGFEIATKGRHIAYDYDRNIHVTRDRTRINERVRVSRAPGARGRIRLSRLTPPKRPSFALPPAPVPAPAAASMPAPKPQSTLSPETEQGSAATTLAERPPLNGWSLQIGTFSRVALAELAAKRAFDKMPGLLGRVPLVVQPVMTPSKTLYRAIYVGLPRETAMRACSTLEATGHSCLTYPPETVQRARSEPQTPPKN